MTILVGYLPTPEGEAAVDAGLREGRLRGERVIIVNSPRRGAPIDEHKIDDAAGAELLRRAQEAGVDAELRQPLHDDDLPETFEALAKETGATLVVIGLRHRSLVGKFIMGSEAQRILMESTVPVLTVKAAQ
ncbi:nucleotide-binding universal stress UspA family protein [Nonomuraea thailandensis]|uniref:Nucleotide-binding universal stress UspA family protein n=1 Tax=Nonomuraea thailandensis TaxID=1188745 RepID=A0A9X2GHM5_9ACTN|nr:universal stress protein [Nonomuraea thailandensis]MCP2359249.1 nucleotide-binding universal stress UspA family protein [Nonomuraea thailandensis]